MARSMADNPDMMEPTAPHSGRRADDFAWPPVARKAGVDLPLIGVLLLFLAIEASWLVSSDLILGKWTSWRDTGKPGDALVQALPWVVHAVVGLLVVGLLRWRRAVGLVRPRPRHLWGILPIVAFAGVAIVDATRLPAWVLPGALLAAMVVNFSTSSFVEELVYRGYLVNGLTKKLGGTSAVFVSALLSALVHFVPSGRAIELRPFLFFFCFAMVMSRIRAATGSIWLGTVAHASFNVFSTIDLWLYRLGDKWPPGAFVHRATTLVGLGIAFGLILKALARWVIRVSETAKSDLAPRSEG